MDHSGPPSVRKHRVYKPTYHSLPPSTAGGERLGVSPVRALLRNRIVALGWRRSRPYPFVQPASHPVDSLRVSLGQASCLPLSWYKGTWIVTCGGVPRRLPTLSERRRSSANPFPPTA